MEQLARQGDRKIKQIVKLITLLFFAGCLVLGLSVGKSLTEGESGDLLNKLISVMLFIFGIALVLILAIVLHELGHLWVGLKNGFRTILAQFLFLQWRREGERMRFHFAWDVRKWNGMLGRVAMIPPADVTVKQMSEHFLGGVRMNVFSGLIAVLVAIALVVLKMPILSIPVVLTFFGGMLSVFLGLTNLYDLTANEIYSDGDVVRLLYRQDANSAAFLESQRMNGRMYDGVRPRDIQLSELVQTVENEGKDELESKDALEPNDVVESSDEPVAKDQLVTKVQLEPMVSVMRNVLAYQKALDAGEWDEAIALIDQIRPDKLRVLNFDPVELANLSILHYSLVQPDVLLADHYVAYLHDHKKGGASSLAEISVMAHYAHLRGNDEEALSLIKKAKDAEKQESDRGGVQMHMDLLHALQAKIGIQTRRRLG